MCYCWTAWPKNCYVPVDWCHTWWSSHIKQTPTTCQCSGNGETGFFGVSSQYVTQLLGAFILPSNSSKALQDWGFYSSRRSGKRHNQGTSCWSECRDCKISCLVGSPIGKQSLITCAGVLPRLCGNSFWQSVSVSGHPAMVDLCREAPCVLPDRPGDWAGTNTERARVPPSSRSEKQQGLTAQCSAVQLEKKMLNTAKGSEDSHIRVSSTREHTFYERRKKADSSACWRESWEEPACLKKKPCTTRKLLVVSSGPGPNEIQWQVAQTSLVQTWTHRREQKVKKN